MKRESTMKLTHLSLHRLFNYLVPSIVLLSFIFHSPARSEVALDGTMGPKMTIEGPEYQITPDHGTVINTRNLFHSFKQFNIDTGQTATFSGPDSIKNILGRVTGGSASNIDGALRVKIPYADLYLLNPSGFIFGPNASLDLSGSFHAASSDYITTDNQGLFYADPEMDSILTIGSPESFGFLSGQPGHITINEASLEVGDEKTLSIIAGDIAISGGDNDFKDNLSAPGGRIDLVSVASPGKVTRDYTESAPGITTESFDTLGDISIFKGSVNAGGSGGGAICIRAEKLTSDSSYIYSSTKGPGDRTANTGIDIKISGKMVLNDSAGTGSVIGSNIFENVDEDSGFIRIKSNELEITNGAGIRSMGFKGSSGFSGEIHLETEMLSINDQGFIQTGTGGSGKSGDIVINTDHIAIQDGGYILSNAFDGTADSGDIFITSDHALLSNEKAPGSLTGISAQTYYPGTGSAGNVSLNTNQLEMNPATEISTPTFYTGTGGNINLTIGDSGSIQGTKETGIDGNPVYTGIFANSFWSGKGGNIHLSGNSLEMKTEASIQVGAFSTGNAGSALIDLNELNIEDSAYIAASGYYGKGGDCGSLTVLADHLNISGPAVSSDPFGRDGTGIFAETGPNGGKGGRITIDTDWLDMTNRCKITSSSYGPGNAGPIDISATRFDVLEGSSILSSAYGSGKGGLINILSDDVYISGVHPDSYIDGITGEKALAPSAIGSQAGMGGGNGEKLKIRTNTLTINDGGRLSTDTFGTGDAGDIDITAEKVTLSGVNADMKKDLIDTGGNPKHAGAGITAGTSATFLGDEATGDGGNISIGADEFIMEKGALISSETTTPGKGGNISISTTRTKIGSNASISAMSRVSEIAGKSGSIFINADSVFSLDDSSILASADNAQGGDINITANQTNLFNTARISAETSGRGNAGKIEVTAANAFMMDKSKVTTEAKAADGGNISVNAGQIALLRDSDLTSSVGGGIDTTGGNILVDPDYIVLDQSRIHANAYEGKGGNITLVSDVFLADSGSSVDASSSLGIDGQVDIRSPVTHISSLVKPLSKDFQSVVTLLREPCMARLYKGEYSSFIIKGRDSLPPQPGGTLTSPVFSE